MKARSAKAKGTRLEKRVEKIFSDLGWQSRRQPGSGIYRDFRGDVAIQSPSGCEVIVECKARKSGFKTLDGWMGQSSAKILVICADREEPMAYLSLEFLAQLLMEERDYGETQKDDEPDTGAGGKPKRKIRRF
jgi:Holliday junction resolvase